MKNILLILKIIKFFCVVFLLMGCQSVSKNYLTYRFKKGEQHYYKKLKWEPSKTAILVVDMWDKHHCTPSEKRVIPIAKKMNPVLSFLRSKGVQIIYAPSDTMKFYKDTINYKRIKQIKPKLKLNHPGSIKGEPELPIKAGCMEAIVRERYPWTRQIKLLKVEPNDLISDNVVDIVSYLRHKEIDLVLYAGVHSNACIIGRPFGMRALRKFGFSVILIRDLTDSYTKKISQFPFQKERNKIIIDHIESYIAPTIHSREFKKNIIF